MNEGKQERQWWLAVEGETTGPHSEAYVVAGLKTGTLSLQTHACPVRGKQWKLLSEWPGFADVGLQTDQRPPNRSTAASAPESLLTNPRLPPMANWICVYTLVVSPMLFVLNNFSCVMTGSTFKDDSDYFGIEVGFLLVEMLLSAALTILLFVGGLRLRALRPSGPKLIGAGLLSGFAIGVFMLFVFFALVASANESDLLESTTGQEIVSFFLLLIGLCEFAFEVVAVVWLFRNAKTLPLQSSQ